MHLNEKDKQQPSDLGPYWLLALVMAARPLLYCALVSLLLLLLSGCSAKQPRATAGLAPQLALPADLLTPCHEPALGGSTYGDFVLYGTNASLALQVCNARLAVIRDIIERYNTRLGVEHATRPKTTANAAASD